MGGGRGIWIEIGCEIDGKRWEQGGTSVENLIWLSLTKTAYENLKRVLHRFRKRVPDDTDTITSSQIILFSGTGGDALKRLTETLRQENSEKKVILGYGIHLQPQTSDNPSFDAITMNLATARKGGRLFLFIRDGTISREKFTLIEDLFDVILKITEDRPSIDQSFVAEVYGPFIPYFEIISGFHLPTTTM